MRKDMAKVLVERPRLIDSAASRGRSLPDGSLTRLEILNRRKAFVGVPRIGSRSISKNEKR